MKPSERIEEIYRTRKDMTPAQSIIQYLDEQAELLETHTVKEPIGKYSKDTGHLVICSSQSGSPFECHICNPSHTVKEEKRTIWVEEAAYNRGYVTGRTDCEKSHTVAPPSNSEKKIPCLCPAWFQDGKGGWIKNTRKDHVKGECPLANVEEQPTTPEKRLKYIDEVGEVTDEMWKFLEKRKLPTSSYEVTCGRCEKSIKHSCGRV